MADYLDEDPVMSTQKYAILSYVLPKDSSSGSPMVKFRGSFSSVEECQKRIKKLQNADTYFHMYVIEVGKWGSLLTEDQLNETEVNQEYTNEKANEFMKSYKEERDKANDSFEQRRVEMKKLAELEGSRQGQEVLANQKEHPLSVKTRLEDTETLLKKLNEDVQEYTKVYEQTKEKYSQFSEEELKQLDQALEKLKVDYTS